MNETSKSKAVWGDVEKQILRGSGIDIGCGPDPVSETVRKFDMGDGDANKISEFVKEQFDFVYASHCLEHMHFPAKAIAEWWKLVKPGGHLFFMVPDEDLYEQGVFPSRFNPDHKATFTLSKAKSWSPVSINVLELANSLPGARIVSLVLHDHGYDRSRLRFGPLPRPCFLFRNMIKYYNGLRRRGLPKVSICEWLQSRYVADDQTLKPNVLAQIQCIVEKTAAVPV